MKPMIMVCASSFAAHDGRVEGVAAENPPHERLEVLERARRIVRIEGRLVPALAEPDTTLVVGMTAECRPRLRVFTEEMSVVDLLKQAVVRDHPGHLGPNVRPDDLRGIVGVIFRR